MPILKLLARRSKDPLAPSPLVMLVAARTADQQHWKVSTLEQLELDAVVSGVVNFACPQTQRRSAM